MTMRLRHTLLSLLAILVAARGIRFHYGYTNPRDWTEGCFVLSSNYYVDGGNIKYSKQSSIEALQNFDNALGGSDLYRYSIYINGKTKNRLGSHFNKKINHSLYLKTR